MFDVEVKPPDINRSGREFTVSDGEILFGLKAVKNMGDVAVREVLEKQPFRSYEDFCERITPRACNKTSKAALVAAGAFDRWGMREEWTPDQINKSEREILGVTISQSQIINKYKDLVARLITSEEQFDGLPAGSPVIVGGDMIYSKEIKTRGGKKMGFVELQFGSQTWQTTLFIEEWAEFYPIIITGDPLMIRGRKDFAPNGKPTIIVDSLATVEEVAMELANRSG
jgi:DNA polymerase III alpha subunit